MKKKRTKKKHGKPGGRNRISLMVSLVLLFCVNTALGSFTRFLNYGMAGYVDSRTVDVYVEDGQDESAVKLFQFLEENTELYSWEEKEKAFFTILLENGSTFEGVHTESYNYKAVKPFLLTDGCEELSENEAVIAKYLLQSGADISTADTDEEILDGEEFLGQTLTCSVRGATCEVKIVGVFDNVTAGMGAGLLMDAAELKTVKSGTQQSVVYDEDGNAWTVNTGGQTVYSVVLSEYGLLTSFMEKMDELGLTAISMSEMDPAMTKMMQGIALLANFILLALVYDTILNMIYSSEHDIRVRRKEFGLLKAMGYRDGKIALLLLWEKTADILIVLAVAFAFNTGMIFLLEWLKEKYLNIFFSALTFVPGAGTVALTVAIGTLAPFAGFLAGSIALRKLEAIGALKDMRE